MPYFVAILYNESPLFTVYVPEALELDEPELLEELEPEFEPLELDDPVLEPLELLEELPETFNCWPTRIKSLVKPFKLFNSCTLMPYIIAILYNVSPLFTV